MARLDRHVDVDSLAVLATVGEAGSLGAAAREHGISQPSATARIDALERGLGLPLLARGPRGSTLTSAGELVVGWARPIFGALKEFSTGVATLREQRSAEFTVAASLTIAEYLLPGWLIELRAAQPEVVVQLRVANSTEVIAAVTRGEVPIGFVEGPAVPRGLAWTQVGADRLAVVVGAAHSWARRGGPVPLTEFCATPLLLREPESGTRQALERAVSAAGGHLAPPALQLSTTTAIRTAAAGGAAPAVLSELTVRVDIAAGRLVEVPVAGLRLRRRLRAVWLRGGGPVGAPADLVRLARDRLKTDG